MFLGLIVLSLGLVAYRPGTASVLRPSSKESTDAQASPSIRTNRCLGDPLQSARKVILDSLYLSAEPRVSVPGMAQIRERWKSIFRDTSSSEAGERHAEDNTPSSSSSSSSSSSPENSTQSTQCCKFTSQIFLTDLGWDKWMIYPESFTFVQCSVCVPQQDQRIFTCRDDDRSAPDPPSEKPCCEATRLGTVPFLYLDETSSLVISNVPLTRECGCSHADDPHALQP